MYGVVMVLTSRLDLLKSEVASLKRNEQKISDKIKRYENEIRKIENEHELNYNVKKGSRF